MKETIASSGGSTSPEPPDQAQVPLRTGFSAAWTALALGAVTLIVVLVFILQNLRSVEVSFLVFSGVLPLGVALLFAAIAGALVVLAVGSARMLQLRLAVHKSHPQISRTDDAARAAPERKPADD